MYYRFGKKFLRNSLEDSECSNFTKLTAILGDPIEKLDMYVPIMHILKWGLRTAVLLYGVVHSGGKELSSQ